MTQEFGPRTAEILPQLTIEEKAAITSGSGQFTMTGVERLGLIDWGMTDGPNGARGSSFLGVGDSMATCVPSGSALGATWNPDLVAEIGGLLGRETRTKGCRVLLAPTVNLHRSPLAGRNFECFSEDPLLSGKLAAAYVRGVQAEGVITTVKHLVGNECETDRYASNSVIDERALRELYLVPFELTVTEGNTLGIMTAYNRLNGLYCNEQPWLIADVVRGEWGFEGFVTTDWYAGGETEAAAATGINLEMPVGDRLYGSVLAKAVHNGQVTESTLDRLAGQTLSAMERIGAFDDEPETEQSIDLPHHRALARRAAAEAMVLLRNEPSADGHGGVEPVLPLDVASLRSMAVIGPNAGRAQIMGGGSANLRPFHRTSPIEALEDRLGDQIDISYSPGCTIDKQAPLMSGATVRTPHGDQGIMVEVFDNLDLAGEPVGAVTRESSRLVFSDETVPGHRLTTFSARATMVFTPTESGRYTVELIQVTPGRVLVDGNLIVDGISDPPERGSAFFGHGSEPLTADLELVAGTDHRIVIEMIHDRPLGMCGLDLRLMPPVPDDMMERAVTVAAGADVAVVVVGTNDDWETEGEDRTTLALPGQQDELIEAVVAANPRTVVVVNTGSPVTMPWVDSAPAIMQGWLGGQEMADALVDVLIGDTDPGGRLPTSLPLCLEHNPSFGNFPGDNGRVLYGEGVFVGYRWYDSRRLPVLFPFGHGLSYTSFEIGRPVVAHDGPISIDDLMAGRQLTVTVPVTNTGDRWGSHVVQCYIHPHQAAVVRPDKELKAFAKVALEAGASTTVTLTLDHRSFAYWDPAQPEWPELRARTATTLPQFQGQDRRTEPGWTIEAGRYDIAVGHSVADLAHIVDLELQ